MDKIEEIRSHLSAADGKGATVSGHRWKAAQLIWEVVNGGESKRGLAEQIGKSHTHVNYMYKCWDLVGRKLVVSGPEDMPDFQTVYTSEEVRGESASKSVPDSAGGGDREPRERKSAADREPRDDESHNVTASELVRRAAEAIGTIRDNEAFWVLLTTEDRKELVKARKGIDRILTA